MCLRNLFNIKNGIFQMELTFFHSIHNSLKLISNFIQSSHSMFVELFSHLNFLLAIAFILAINSFMLYGFFTKSSAQIFKQFHELISMSGRQVKTIIGV